MADLTSKMLGVLAAHGISPEEDEVEIDLPGVGELEEGETVYTTSIAEVLGENVSDEADRRDVFDVDNPRIGEWLGELERVIAEGRQSLSQRKPRRDVECPEPHCAWYCPIHFFGHGWGIYLRESCILSFALKIATFVDWSSVKISTGEVARQLLRSSFYIFFLHEQFHHKVESFGFRLLVSTGGDRYRPYKRNVYRPNYLTSNCREESLANAESFRRLSEGRYKKRVDLEIRRGLRRFLEFSIPLQPPGYSEGVQYFPELSYRRGLFELQSMILDGKLSPTTLPDHWSVAPKMISSLADIASEIYVVLPRGARPLFNPTHINPGYTVSSQQLESALVRHYGYAPVAGGKGSHVKLKKAGSPTIVLTGNRAVVSPGIIKQVLSTLGAHPISRLPDLLEGRL